MTCLVHTVTQNLCPDYHASRVALAFVLYHWLSVRIAQKFKVMVNCLLECSANCFNSSLHLWTVSILFFFLKNVLGNQCLYLSDRYERGDRGDDTCMFTGPVHWPSALPSELYGGLLTVHFNSQRSLQLKYWKCFHV